MSQENVDLIQSLYTAFFKRDVPFILSVLHPDVTVVQSPELPWGGTYHGITGFQQFFTTLTTHLDNRALPIDRYLDAGDHVVAIGRTQGFVRATGKPFDVPLAHLWQIQDGKILAFRPFIDLPTMRPALAL